MFCCYTQCLVAQWQSLLQWYLLDCVGAEVVISEVPGDWTSICRCCKCRTYRSYSCFTPSNKSLNRCIFKNILGLCYRVQRHRSPRESCSCALQKKKLLRIPYSKGIVILLSLEIFMSFCNHKAIQANLCYLFMCFSTVTGENATVYFKAFINHFKITAMCIRMDFFQVKTIWEIINLVRLLIKIRLIYI